MPLATTALRRGRRLAAASLLAVTALSLTACGDNGSAAPAASASAPSAPDDGGKAGTTGAGGSGGATSGGSAAGDGQAGGGGTSGGKGGSGTGGSAGSSSAGGSGGTGSKGGASAGRKGATGTWTGTLKWLTEDKLTVVPKTGMEQAFYLTGSTKALGAATICEAPDGRVHMDSSGYGTTSCTLADLRKAARLGSVEVRVTLDDGAATKVAEHYHP
ncbi:hypothetical protein ACFCVY_35395 [Streptomyces sp. NPDC056411]|uniref:hypothetical protein n=1 Tax=Streptomyces sp. NPDC056411 TaxID=3345813 RepID=UPI0035DAC79E